MESLYNSHCDEFFKHYSYPNFSSHCDDPLMIEIWPYQSSVTTRMLAVRDIIALPLAPGPGLSIDRSQEHSCPQLRIVWIPHQMNSPILKISKEDFELLVVNLRLELAFKYSYAGPAGFVFLLVSAAERKNLLVCSVGWGQGLLLGICWTHDLEGHRTTALCWGLSSHLSEIQVLLD